VRVPEPVPAAEPTQVMMFKVVDELLAVSTGPLDAALFQPPAGYRRVGG
jgi:hypothetical protein